MGGLFLLLLVPAPAGADDPPNIDFSRQVLVTFKADEVHVRYRLEISTFTLARLPQLDKAIDIAAVDKTQPQKSLAELYLKRLRVLVPDQLHADANEIPLKWELADPKPIIEFRDSIHYVLHLRSPWKPKAGENRIEVRDDNFASQPGRFVLKLDTEQWAGEADLQEPKESDTRLPRSDQQRTGIAILTLSPTAEAPVIETPVTKPAEPTPPAASSSKLLSRFDTSSGLIVVFLLAFIFGAAHALTPGHGKTLVAAYLIGERGTTKHAFILGLVTTITHTGSVIIIALILWVLYPNTVPEDVQHGLAFVGGLLIAALGLWLLLRRLAGQADHVHFSAHAHSHGGHEHAHGGAEHSHSHGELGKGGMLRLILLGITGGIIPCWDAVILLGIAISTHQLWLGVPLLLVFSAGLASVLIAIGIAVVYAKRFGAGRWSESRWFKALPVVSALLVIAIGLWLCVDSFS